MEANSLDFTDAYLTLSHYGAVSEFIGDVHNTGPSAPQSQPESDSGEIGPGASVPDDSNRINESSGHDADDPSIVLETPNYTISINQEVHHVEPSVPVDESQESTPTRPFTSTLAPIPEDESEESTSSLPQDSSSAIAQQETHTMEATLEASESSEVINETSEVTIDESESTEDINQEPESSEAINEASDSTSLPQEEGDTLQVESEVTSIEDTAEPTTPQDTSLVQPDSSLNEVAIANATDASNDQSGSQDLTPPVTVPHTGEVQDDHDSSEDGTPQSHSAPSTEADATPSTEPRSLEHPTTIEQQEQSDNVSIDQGVYDVTAGLHSFGNDISVVQFSEDSEDHVQKFITFSDGVTATYSFFIMHNTPLCTPPDPLKGHKFSEHVEGLSAERDDLFSASYISDVHWEDITLPDDDQSDDENELDVYLTDDLTTLGEPSSGFQVQPSTTPDTVEHTIPTETTSIPPEVESTIQLESTSVDVRAEHTSPDSTESTPTEFYSILTDKQGPTQHTVLSEESSEDSENSQEQESSSDSQGMTEVSQNSSDELEGSALKTNLRATDSHVTDSLKPSDNSHINVEELSENQAENLEVKSEFPSSSLEQHTTPVSDCNIWF